MSSQWRQRGLSLVELLIALVLSALIMTSLVSAMAGFGMSSERIERYATESDQMRLIFAFLQNSINNAPPKTYVDPQGGSQRIWLHGDADQLEWLGLMPARNGAGGLTHFRLAVEEIKSQPVLALRYSPFEPGRTRVDWAKVSPQILLKNMGALRLQYRGGETQPWRNRWHKKSTLPAYIEITIETDEATWPKLKIPLLFFQTDFTVMARCNSGRDVTEGGLRFA